MTLTEDLVKERMKSEEISESLDGLHKQLKQVGLGKSNSQFKFSPLDGGQHGDECRISQ